MQALLERWDRRRARLADSTIHRLGKLHDQGRLDATTLLSDEYADLVFAVIDSAQRAKAEATVELHAAILTGAASIDRDPRDDHAAMASALVELTPIQLHLLRDIYQSLDGSLPVIARPYSVARARECGVARPGDEIFHLKRIEQAGLIYPSDTVRYDQPREPEFVATETLLRLMTMARETADPE